ncbi:MAG: MAPEG family protein [Gammaproteobacteria bacterium]|jgi:uncharacterized MAPEG superfamily protein|nr:MAPEG family protein [Gammaproteobacteria bacterium]
MTTVISCLLVLCILPIACAWIAGYFRHKQFGAVDNKEPRVQSAQLTGAGARAVAAQANCWEALALFSAALLALVIAGVALESIASLAIAFTLLRLVYIALYIADRDALRSLVFIGGFGICMYLFYLALSN